MSSENDFLVLENDFRRLENEIWNFKNGSELLKMIFRRQKMSGFVIGKGPEMLAAPVFVAATVLLQKKKSEPIGSPLVKVEVFI